MPVLNVRREGEDKNMEYLIENSSDSDDIVNKTDFDNITTISQFSSMAQPKCFDQSELNDLVRDLSLSKELKNCQLLELGEARLEAWYQCFFLLKSRQGI